MSRSIIPYNVQPYCYTGRHYQYTLFVPWKLVCHPKTGWTIETPNGIVVGWGNFNWTIKYVRPVVEQHNRELLIKKLQN